jgi:uncharacterized protein (TIGR02453 family)
MKNIIPFIKKLRSNNNREWFNEHKGEYLEVKVAVENFTQEVLNGIAQFDKDLREMTVKRSIFRIYRDIRFSHDKTLYKTHIGIFLSKGGAKAEVAGYYCHFEPNSCFIGAGVYGLQPEGLRKVRNGIYFNCAEFKKILSSVAIKRDFGGKLDDYGKLKTAPKGFDKDFPDIELLKYKHYFLSHDVIDKEIVSGDYAQQVIKWYKELYPFVSFLNSAIDF